MCGIAGHYNWPSRVDLAEMSLRIAHRGPDGHDTWVEESPDRPNVGLAHRRLAIIDLVAQSDQPMVKDGLVLVFNGEIYNYLELRDELHKLGATFRTHSDTEVLLEAWRFWGADALKRLRGMFAFALYDTETSKLVLARDHFGIKPLFISEKHGGVAFCSELKGLMPALGRVEIDNDALVSSLTYVWIPETMSMIKGVRKLPPGHWVEYDRDGTSTQHQYWNPVEELAGLPPATVDELADAMADSVKAHMVADVPVASFLSGGLDSSLITVLAQQHVSDLQAFTINFREEDKLVEAMPDDFHYAKKLADQFGISLNEIKLEPDVVSMVPKLAYFLDEPIGDTSAMNAYLICEQAREMGAKVLLSGMGADEIFGGYRRQLGALVADRYRKIPSGARSLIEAGVDKMPVAIGDKGIRSTRWAKRFLSFASLPEEQAYRRSYTYYDQSDFGRLLSPDLMDSVDRVFADHARIYNSAPFDDPVNRMCFTDLHMFLSGLNLAVTDRSSMYASTEVRVPFVDIDMVKMAFRFSGKEKIAGKTQKAVLKKAAEKVLPREIIYRPKAAFSVPIRSWIGRDLDEMVSDTLPNGHLVSDGFCQREEIENIIEANRSGKVDRAHHIWHLLVLEEWLSQHSTDVAEMNGSGV